MKFHKIDGARPTAGHYTPAVQSNNMLFISGQVPSDPFTGEICNGDFKEQMLQTLNNLKTVLKASGADLENLVKVNIYITDGGNWGLANEVYSEFMGDHKPARTILPVPPLHKGYEVEIDAIAEL